MKRDLIYFIKVLLIGFGIIPFIASFIVAILTLVISVPFQLGAGRFDTLYFLLFALFCFTLSALVGVFTIGKQRPIGIVARYLPVCLPLLATLVTAAVCMVVSGGYKGHDVFAVLFYLEVAFFPINTLNLLFGSYEAVFLIPIFYQIAFLLLFFRREKIFSYRPPFHIGYFTFYLIVVLASTATIGYVFFTRTQTVLPRDYGFAYGNGYASVNIYQYDVRNEQNILPALSSPSTFIISELDKMPRLDGAEAAFPVYSAFANACYLGIATSEYEYFSSEELQKYSRSPGDRITFTNTIFAFERLLNGEVDIFFGAAPSQAQLAMAENAGKILVLTPIGKDAFVFFVNKNNDCNGLTTQDIHDIYSGKVKNWVSITGKNQRIYAFQRPENSGSQTILQTLMQDVPLAEPLREEYISAMGGVSENVANYRNYPGAIGYSFRFFTTAMAGDTSDIKLLDIDGIAPTLENIASGAYPYTVFLYAITLEDNELGTVQPFLEWMQGEQGQELVQKVGYVGVRSEE